MKTIRIPTINDGVSDFCTLFKTYNEIVGSRNDVILDFSRCGFLRQNAVAFLGGLSRVMDTRTPSLHFKWSSLPNDISTNLAQNGFLGAIRGGSTPWTGNSIPYREDRIINPDEIIDYLKTKWLGRGWINISPKLANLIAGNLFEVFANAFEHSHSDVGVFTCGQYYPQLRELSICIADFGVGIPYNVREYSKQEGIAQTISSDQAIRWAFQPGTTTKPNGSSRGLGLDILKQFIKINDGNLYLFSQDAYVIVNSEIEEYKLHRCHFQGTILNITIKCDEKYYVLSGETLPPSLF
jgi:anti-sigma regulatory factor (Ser/Thr protein kinase)